MNNNEENPPARDICVDASLWVRWLTPEKGSDEVKNIFLLWLDEFNFFIAPSLLVFEVYSALRKKVKKGELKPDVLQEAMDRFSRLPVLLYQSEEFFRQTWELSEQMRETVLYDVSYLALAAWKKVPFYTADQEFYEKARKFYPDVHCV